MVRQTVGTAQTSPPHVPLATAVSDNFSAMMGTVRVLTSCAIATMTALMVLMKTWCSVVGYGFISQILEKNYTF